MKIAQICHFLEQAAPLAYQEQYDNAGLLVGDPQAALTGITVSLDVTEQVIREASEKGCNLIVSHHPIIFSGLKKLTGRNYVERCVMMAIKHDIALYAIHTNLDNVQDGVNARIAAKLSLKGTAILQPKGNALSKLTVFVPTSHQHAVIDAISAAGAGQIGNYSHCTFRTEGTGSFKPNERANPFIGESGKLEEVQEARVEAVLPTFLQSHVLRAMKKAHPYEEAAYFMQPLDNQNQTIGAGMVGELPKALAGQAFLQYLKEKMGLSVIRHTEPLTTPIEKVAVCGGSGSFLLPAAVSAGAQVFITSDYKYHQFFDADNRIMIADIGHYESERFTVDLLSEWLQATFKDVPVHPTEVITNPVQYFL